MPPIIPDTIFCLITEATLLPSRIGQEDEPGDGVIGTGSGVLELIIVVTFMFISSLFALDAVASLS